ncbi:unnamed protein product [Macrosiphum euphorbiae]|uniref:Uncharacterized protein n=1 Tax=Macrosiphum euphorbiae TaxID=13131 RepID=A0AAV0Y163_9HEMI|nr:unnamed protein product [Macrosiphum euphorbiae]
MEVLDDIEAACVLFALYEEHESSYPEEFMKYYRMSITSFDELISLVGPKLSKQHTGLRVPISPEERLTVTLR